MLKLKLWSGSPSVSRNALLIQEKMDINIKKIIKSSAETHTNLDVHIMKQLKLGASSSVIKYQRVKTLWSNLPEDPCDPG